MADLRAEKIRSMYDEWFVPLSQHRLQICSNGGTTTATSDLAMCEAVFHVYGSTLVVVVEGTGLVVVYFLATSKVTPGQVPICDSTHSWQIDSTASLGHQAASSMTCCPTKSHYPDTELYPNNDDCQARKRQVSILKSFV